MREVPSWMRNVSHLSFAERRQRALRWLQESRDRMPERSAPDAVRAAKGKWELLRDSVEEALQTGASWDDLARAFGVSARMLRSAFESP